MTTPPCTDRLSQGKENGGLARLLARREMELAAAQRMSEVFSQQIKLQDLMAQALRIALDVVDAENGSILLADPDARQLVFYHSIGAKPVPSGTAVPWDEGIAGTVFRTGHPEIVPDAQTDTRHFKSVDEATGSITHDMITIPLRQWEGAPIGIPWVQVPGDQPRVPVTFEYDDSDPGPYPIPADAPIEGGLYYWASGSDGACAGRCGIYRHDLAQPEMAAEPYYTSVEAGRCVACHALSRDGSRMAVTYDGGDGPGSMVDVASRTATPTPGNWNYATYTPTADRLITALNGYLDIRDPLAGTVVGQIPTGQFATQPDFSPNGNFIAYAGNPTYALPRYNVTFGGANLVVQPYDGAGYGAPVNIVTSAGENNYYPSVSPDGSWIAFNRSTGDSYDDVDAEVWAVPSVGGTPMRLDTANIQTGLYNSWVRWAPFEQTVNGERMYWLTFSSRRQFGVRLPQNTRPQVWMAAFFPDRAAAGIDPTAPAFWLPFQDITTNNHIAQWAEQVIPIE